MGLLGLNTKLGLGIGGEEAPVLDGLLAINIGEDILEINTDADFLEFGGAPIEPSGTPEAWYDATTLVLNNNDPVVSWTDKSGNAHHLTGTSPVFKSTGGGDGSKAYVEFTKALSHYLTNNWGGAQAQPVTIFAVLKVRTVLSGDYILGSTNAGNRCGEVVGGGVPSDWTFYAGVTANTGEPIDTNWHVLTFLFNSASSTMRIDGSQVGGTLDVGTKTYNGFEIGSILNGAGNHSDIDVGEVLIYYGNESPAYNEAGLMEKWGL